MQTTWIQASPTRYVANSAETLVTFRELFCPNEAETQFNTAAAGGCRDPERRSDRVRAGGFLKRRSAADHQVLLVEVLHHTGAARVKSCLGSRPFEHIPDQVNRSPRVGAAFRTDGRGLVVRLIDHRTPCFKLIAPGIEVPLRTITGSIFPLRLGRKSVCHAVTLRPPLCESFGVGGTYKTNRHRFLAGDRFAVDPMRRYIFVICRLDELTVFGVGDFRLVHAEVADRHFVLGAFYLGPVAASHHERTAR